VLYLGELNDAQHAGWVRAVEAFEGKAGTARQLALFPDDREALPGLECEAVHIRIDGIRLSRPRQWGGCWLALWLWDLLALDDFWRERLAPSRKKTRWLNVLKTLTVYRLLSPGSEWRLHREWFAQTAMADLLGEDAAVAQKNTLYRCLDKLLDYRDDMFGFLRDRWSALFDAKFDVLLYDLTSTYFEANPPAQDGLKKHGYSRDHRPDCVQVVIALVVTPDGFPLAYEVMPGNTADSSTLREFLELIEKRHGKIHRTWLMDRGIPTEETLEQMRSDGVGYLVGTPKGRLSKLEARLLDRGWEQAREEVRVKLLGEGDEFYVYVESRARVFKERSMRRRRLKKLWRRLHELKAMKQTRDQLLLRLGAAKKDAGRAWRFLHVTIPGKNEAVTPETFCFELNKPRLREARRREGRYLLRSNLTAESPEFIWEKYLLLTRIEQAFKDLKSDLSIRPIYHQGDERIKAHIFVCFLAYCLQATLKNLARGHAGGLTPRSILEKFNRMQMIDVHLPTTDDRTVVLHRHTEPDAETRLLLAKLHLTLPAQPPPRVHPTGEIAM
jgi:transposase